MSTRKGRQKILKTKIKIKEGVIKIDGQLPFAVGKISDEILSSFDFNFQVSSVSL